jgi:hypothetical protein
LTQWPSTFSATGVKNVTRQNRPTILFNVKETITNNISPEEVKQIAEEAYIYAFPMLMGYRFAYATFLQPASPAYRGPDSPAPAGGSAARWPGPEIDAHLCPGRGGQDHPAGSMAGRVPSTQRMAFVISVGPMTSTGQFCSEGIMDQEQAYLASLQSASSYTINGTTLTLTMANGPLTFSAAAATPYAGS